jgi:hypothetical protein
MNLAFRQLFYSVGRQPETYLLNSILSHAPELINLMTFLHLGVHSEVLIGHNYFCVPVVNLLLPYRIFLSHHVVATYKDGLEEFAF